MVNIKKIEKITITGTVLLVFSIIMFLFPIHSIIAKPTDCKGLPSSGDVPLKSVHQGQTWDYFPQEGCDTVSLNEGQYLWHLVLSPVTDGASATINGIVGDNHGGSIHWTFINNDPNAQNWVASVSNGLEYSGQNCNLQTDLRVSHTCAGVITSETTAAETTAAETTAVETTAAETTAAVTTASETTAAVTTASETTATGTTASETTSAETTASETTAAVTTASETTAAETTAAGTTASETTAAVTTASETTAAVTTASETTATGTTTSETTAAETTASETTAAGTTASETTAAETTAVVVTETTVEILSGTSDIRVAEGTAAAGVIQVLGIKRLAYTGYNFSYLIIGAIALLIGVALISIRRFYRK
jgi:hypothetical protein